ncbi:hypothetical protein [Luteimonas sp. SDU101]|uniref:hypothetical protein n=1 Tax=Luteimonas sp. SDU101 TaxID=3422593 RepID=UPI003EBA8703
MHSSMPLVRTMLALVLACTTSAVVASETDAAFYQRAQVTHYAVREAQAPGPRHEQLRLWADRAGHVRVHYAWGPEPKELALALAGRSADGEGFALRFPNGLVLDAVLQGQALRVRDRSGGYDKVFEWKYEGPVDGRGTACTACVEEADAAAFVRRHFIAR